MNNNYRYFDVICLFDERTFYDLSSKELILKYLIRIIVLLFPIGTFIFLSYTKISYIEGYLYLTGFIILEINLLIYCNLIYRKLYIKRIAFEKENYFAELTNLLDRIGKIPDSQRKSQIRRALIIIKYLNEIYSLSRERDKLILLKRYHASFMFYFGRYKKALSILSTVDKYYSSLNDEFKNNEKIKAEMARVILTRATILLALRDISIKEAIAMLETALTTFKDLNLPMEVDKVESLINNLKIMLKKVK